MSVPATKRMITVCRGDIDSDYRNQLTSEGVSVVSTIASLASVAGRVVIADAGS